MQTLKDGFVVEFCGTKFLVQEVSPGYRTLTPVTDQDWLLRFLHKTEDATLTQ